MKLYYPFLKDMNDIIDDESKFDLYTSNQAKRDSDSWHCTVINVMEYNKSIKALGMSVFMEKLNALFGFEIDDLEFKGVGTDTRNTNEAYYVVLSSDKLDEVRASFGLKPRDLHITLGFDPKDVFGVSKGEDTIVKKTSKLRKVLDSLWRNQRDWSFLFDIKNFPDELKIDDKIEALSLSDTVLNVKIGHTLLQIILIEIGDKEELYIGTQSEYKEEE